MLAILRTVTAKEKNPSGARTVFCSGVEPAGSRALISRLYFASIRS
jgi:hypothetical protein